MIRNATNRIREELSAELSARKRRCCNMMVSVLGCTRLQSRFLEQSKEEMSPKFEAVALAKTRLLCHFDNGDLDCNHESLLAVTNLSCPGGQADIISRVMD